MPSEEIDNAALKSAELAWSNLDAKNKQIDNLEWNCEVLSWSAAVGWIIAIVAVVIAIVK